MLSAQRGDAAVAELQVWAEQIAKRADPAVQARVEFEDDSNTFIVRLAKGNRVLIFRLSESQVTPTAGRPNANARCKEKSKICGI